MRWRSRWHASFFVWLRCCGSVNASKNRKSCSLHANNASSPTPRRVARCCARSRESLARELIVEHRKLDFEGLRLAYAHLGFPRTRDHCSRLARRRLRASRRTSARSARARDQGSQDPRSLARTPARDISSAKSFVVEQRELDDDNARRYIRSAQSAQHQGV